MESEWYEKWEPVKGITTPVARALIKEDEEGLSVTLIFSEIIDGLDTDLRINFGRVAAYSVYDEFVHPCNEHGSEPIPKLNEGRWKDWSSPLLIVKNSVWLGSFADYQLIDYPNNIHYRFVTLDKTVDVLCNNRPEVSWVKLQANG
jgi:hypothetical protein